MINFKLKKAKKLVLILYDLCLTDMDDFVIFMSLNPECFLENVYVTS